MPRFNAQSEIQGLKSTQTAILAVLEKLAGKAPTATPDQTAPAEESSRESVIEIADDADRPSAKPKIEKGPARQAPAGTFRLRRKSGGGGGTVDWSQSKGKSGLAACPAYDDSSRKVTVKEFDQKKGVNVEVEKTLSLDDFTRNTVGPMLAEQYRTVEDTEETHRSRTAKTIRLAQVDDQGRVIPGTMFPMLFCTSESGTFMVRGELAVKAVVTDKHGKGQVVFTPASRGEVFLMGKSFNRIDS